MKHTLYKALLRSLFLFLIMTGNISPVLAQPTDNSLLTRMNQGRMPGASFAAVKEGKLIYHKNLGHADRSTNKVVDDETIFMQASVSKTFIATAVMQLWEKDQINLDIDINRYLPFNVRIPAFPGDSITARMLLTHTSSIKDEWNTLGSLYVLGDSPISMKSFLQGYFTPGGLYYKASNFHPLRPGTTYDYSNVATTLAAYLVETITGDEFHHYCDTAIFQKLCMNSSSFLLAGISDTSRIARPYVWDNGIYWDAGLYGYPDYPDGQLRTTSTDLARFMTMYLQYGEYEGVRVLDSTTVAYILSQQTPVDPDQGIIFYSANASNGDKLWGHNGGDAGVNTAMYFNIQKKTGAIAMTNGDGSASSNADLLVNTIYTYAVTVNPVNQNLFPDCTPATSTEIAYHELKMSVYPNPVSDRLMVEINESAIARISDIHGKVLLQIQLNSGHNEIEIPGSWMSGMYLMSISGHQGKNNNIRKLHVIR